MSGFRLTPFRATNRNAPLQTGRTVSEPSGGLVLCR
jgi:hypothetical protein